MGMAPDTTSITASSIVDAGDDGTAAAAATTIVPGATTVRAAPAVVVGDDGDAAAVVGNGVAGDRACPLARRLRMVSLVVLRARLLRHAHCWQHGGRVRGY